ncbi:hypothetical protein EJ08DRAFT_690576 [Tothia fuscella]|uniref:N(6)-L-threonylcarbamoyladenine synthase n=1 Tax=Tothia fuscella TaxID=1048955 RepID=A0A9P4NFE9_9PEZI|nr:hypothetical protein EJ08DRAFT_690576 [Tothia fuscella]
MSLLHAAIASSETCFHPFPTHSLLQIRAKTILAIETSCDDTAVAVLDIDTSDDSTRSNVGPKTKLIFNEKITANNAAFRGIHPMVAHESHQVNLAKLVARAIDAGTRFQSRDEDFDAKKEQRFVPSYVAVTRGPGMRTSLTTGLDTAKGLAVAWNCPLIGVHHMQAHALTPRLCHALNSYENNSIKADHFEPAFPFLTLLVSGGHTILLRTESVADHIILASTSDIAIGDCIDKIGRIVVPQQHLANRMSVSFGPILEAFALPRNKNGVVEYDYIKGTEPTKWGFNIAKRKDYGWKLPMPLHSSEGGTKKDSMEFSFTGLVSYVTRIAQFGYLKDTQKLGKTPRDPPISDQEAQLLAQEAMRTAFIHLASRIVTALRTSPAKPPIRTLVLSGGVASNLFLRHLLRAYLDVSGFEHVKLEVPPVEYCTDNAAMIAWAAWEMICAGHVEKDMGKAFEMRVLRKWRYAGDWGEDGFDGEGGRGWCWGKWGYRC